MRKEQHLAGDSEWNEDSLLIQLILENSNNIETWIIVIYSYMNLQEEKISYNKNQIIYQK